MPDLISNPCLTRRILRHRFDGVSLEWDPSFLMFQQRPLCRVRVQDLSRSPLLISGRFLVDQFPVCSLVLNICWHGTEHMLARGPAAARRRGLPRQRLAESRVREPTRYRAVVP